MLGLPENCSTCPRNHCDCRPRVIVHHKQCRSAKHPGQAAHPNQPTVPCACLQRVDPHIAMAIQFHFANTGRNNSVQLYHIHPYWIALRHAEFFLTQEYINTERAADGLMSGGNGATCTYDPLGQRVRFQHGGCRRFGWRMRPSKSKSTRVIQQGVAQSVGIDDAVTCRSMICRG